jgi:pimeloyl-ACP methyl ester carboxylesterase
VAAAFPELVRWVVSIDGLGPPPEAMGIDDYADTSARWLADAETAWSRSRFPREYASIEEMAARRRQVNIRMSDGWALHLARHGSRLGPGGGLVWKTDPVMRIGGPGPFSEDILLSDYRQIRCPVTVLTGAEPDTWSDLGSEVIDRRLAAMPTGCHRVVEAAGHYIHLERPDEVLGEIAGMERA